MAQVEALTGISKAFLQWAKKNSCEAFRGSKIYLAPLKKFHEAHISEWEDLSSDDGSQASVNKERIIMLRKQQRKLDMEYQTASGELVNKADVLEMQGKLITRWIDIIKRTVSKAHWNAIANQFQAAPFETL